MSFGYRWLNEFSSLGNLGSEILPLSQLSTPSPLVGEGWGATHAAINHSHKIELFQIVALSIEETG